MWYRNMTASWVRDGASSGGTAEGERAERGGGGGREDIGDLEDIAGGAGDRPGRRPPELCDFYESLEAEGNDADIPMGVYDLDQLKELGRQRGWCPYFLARRVSGDLWCGLDALTLECYITYDRCLHELISSCTIINTCWIQRYIYPWQ